MQNAKLKLSTLFSALVVNLCFLIVDEALARVVHALESLSRWVFLTQSTTQGSR